MKYDLLRILANLPKRKAINVRIEDVATQIKRLIGLTGFDMIGGLRQSDVDEFVSTYSKNWEIDILHDRMEGTLRFYNKK